MSFPFEFITYEKLCSIIISVIVVAALYTCFLLVEYRHNLKRIPIFFVFSQLPSF